MVYYCFTHISGLPYNFSTFTNCLGDLEGVGTRVSRIGWNIIFLMGNGNAKPRIWWAYFAGYHMGDQWELTIWEYMDLSKKGGFTPTKYGKFHGTKMDQRMSGCPWVPYFWTNPCLKVYAVSLEKGLNLVLPKTTIEALQCFRHVSKMKLLNLDLLKGSKK